MGGGEERVHDAALTTRLNVDHGQGRLTRTHVQLFANSATDAHVKFHVYYREVTHKPRASIVTLSNLSN